MIRYFRIIVSLIVIFTFCCTGLASNSDQPMENADFFNSIEEESYYKDFTMAGFIVSKSTKREVEKIYSRPLSTKMNNGEYGKVQFCKYKDFELTYAEMYVDGVKVPDLLTNAIFFRGPYKTARGIKISDSEDLVIKKYGLPYKEKGAIYYNVDMLYIRFYIANHSVTKIEIQFVAD